MSEFYVKPGDSVTFAKTVGETDIYLFAGITGDFAVNHVNEQYMARSKYGKRIAHGALLIGFASTCSTMMIEKCHGTAGDETAVSLGYDKVRFLGPVYIGDTVTLTYTIIEVDPVKRRSRSEIKVVNQNGELVGVAHHILAWVKDKVSVMSMRLKDKVCIVTGGGSGIGRATACCSHAKVPSWRRRQTQGRRAEAVREECAKLGAEAALRSRWTFPRRQMRARMVDETIKAFGRLDVLVNNAGYGIAGSVVETEEQAWDDLMAVNVRGVFLCAKFAIPAMKANGGGAIVNTASWLPRSAFAIARPTAPLRALSPH